MRKRALSVPWSRYKFEHLEGAIHFVRKTWTVHAGFPLEPDSKACSISTEEPLLFAGAFRRTKPNSPVPQPNPNFVDFHWRQID